MKDYHSSVR